MATVFVSHAGADTDTALVVGWLKDDRHSVRVDHDPESGIAAGDEWERRLYAWLREADAMVCVVTSDYLTSAWCAAEIGAARTHGCRVIPVTVERGARHPLLASLQHVDLVDDPDRGRSALLNALRRVDAAGSAGWPDDRSPFPGLNPFDAKLRGVFFGRTAEVSELVKTVRSPAGGNGGLLPVVGPSGCGKSSLVRAGLVPELAGDPEWLTLPPFAPGQDPEWGFASALGHIGQRLGLPGDLTDTRARLRRDGILGVATTLLDAASAKRLLVVVDQFEELFRETSRPDVFLDLLGSAADTRVQVVVTLRSEFLDVVLDEPGLSIARPLAVRPLGREALRFVVEEPARVAGIEVDSELVARLVDDTGSGEALPLLAFTLAELAEGIGRGGRLSPERYEQLGGVQGALIEQADAALADARHSTGRSPDAVVDGLLQLVTVDAQREPTRRWVDLADLSPPVASELHCFVERRLLTTDQRDDGSVYLGVAHEAFLWTWPPIVHAIDGARPALRTAGRVEEKADEWVDAGRRPDWDQLWTGGQLAAVIDTIERHDAPEDRRRGWRRWAPALLQPPSAVTASRVPLSDDARAFLVASSRQDRRRRRRTTTVLSLLLVVALLASGVTTALWQVSRHQQQTTTARQLITLAESLRASDPATAVRLGIAAEEVHPGVETRSALAASLISSRFAGALPGPNVILEKTTFSPDGRTMAALSRDGGSVVFWDVAARPPARLTELADAQADEIAFTPDGRTLVTASQAGMVTVWDVEDRSTPRRAGPVLQVSGTVAPGPEVEPQDVPTADGRDAEADDADGRDTDDDPRPGPVLLAMSPDGRTLAAAGGSLPEGSAVLVDIADSASVHRLGQPIDLGTSVHWMEFDRSGRALLAEVDRPRSEQRALGESDHYDLAVWDVSDRAAPRSIGRSIPHSAAAFAGGRSLLATASVEGGPAVTLTDFSDPLAPRTATTIALTDGPPGPSYWLDRTTSTLSFSVDGSTLAVAVGRQLTGEGWLAFWEVADPSRPRQLLNEPSGLVIYADLPPPPGGVRVGPAVNVAFLPGRRAVAFTGIDGRLSVYDYSNGDLRQTGSVIESDWNVAVVGLLPDGSAAVSRNGLLWDLTERWAPRRIRAPLSGDAAVMDAPQRIRVPLSGDTDVADMVFLDGPRSLAVARQDGSADLLNLSAGNGPSSSRRLASPSVAGWLRRRDAALAPDAGVLAIVQPDDGSVTVTDLGDEGRTARIPVARVDQAERAAQAVTFLPNGILVISGGASSGPRFLTIWDVADLNHPRLVVPPVESNELLGVTQDGSLAVRFALQNRGVEMVDMTASDGPQRIGEPLSAPDEAAIPAVSVPAVGLSPDGAVLAMTESGQGVALWDLADRSAPHRLPVTLTSLAGHVMSLVFSPDGRTLAMAVSSSSGIGYPLSHAPGEVLLWDVSDPAQPRRLISSAVHVGVPPGPVVFSADGSTLATVDSDDRVEAWDLAHVVALRDNPGAAACEVVGRGLDRAEWSRYVPDEDFVDTCAA